MTTFSWKSSENCGGVRAAIRGGSGGRGRAAGDRRAYRERLSGRAYRERPSGRAYRERLSGNFLSCHLPHGGLAERTTMKYTTALIEDSSEGLYREYMIAPIRGWE